MSIRSASIWPRRSLLTRVGTTIAAGSAVTISLLVFPNEILWMVAAWIACFSGALGRSPYAWMPLAVCVVILLVKSPDWSTMLVVLTASMVVIALFTAFAARWPSRYSRKLRWIEIAVLWMIWSIAFWESHVTVHSGRRTAAVGGRPVVCLGNSLTTGLSDADAYPKHLQELIQIPVHNFGREGISARDALKLLPSVLETRPQVVVIELGGHDFLHGYGKASTRGSLVQIIEACQRAGADVVLVEVPRGFIVDPFGGLERELSRTYDLELIPDTTIRKFVLRSFAFPLSGILGLSNLSDDGLHPNESGARLLAEKVRDALARLYGRAVVNSNP